MAKISARTATWAKWAVVPAALLVSGVAVSQASYSAFSAKVESSTSNWTAGTVALDGGSTSGAGANASTAMFTATNLKPGSTGAKCITVTSSGTLASTVKLYGTTPNTTKALSSNIDLVITEGTGADSACTDFAVLTPAAPTYTGTLAAFGTDKTGFATGWGSWAPTGTATQTRTYKIAYTVKSDAPNGTQGGTASMGFTWEAQNS
ncbi:hypothetical protein AB4089_02260 [Arthrobacter sp. 2MCAF15]|uniref:hypothetical protein n=1 Tax=Arthrobacter sp. 2MCAF15 TaxID=3232984 RepID=UPI003F909FA0